MSFPIPPTWLAAGAGLIPVVSGAASAAADATLGGFAQLLQAGSSAASSAIWGSSQGSNEVGLSSVSPESSASLDPRQQIEQWGSRLEKELQQRGWPRDEPIVLELSQSGQLVFGGSSQQQELLSDFFAEQPHWQEELEAITGSLANEVQQLPGGGINSTSADFWKIEIAREQTRWSSSSRPFIR